MTGQHSGRQNTQLFGGLTEARVLDYQEVLRTPNASTEAKIHCINEVKGFIKRNHLDESIVWSLFELIRQAILAPNMAISSTGSSTLPVFVKRLLFQNVRILGSFAAATIPLLTDLLGDSKEDQRALAVQCLMELWKAAPSEVERQVRETLMPSRNPRVKVSTMSWISRVCLSPSLLSSPLSCCPAGPCVCVCVWQPELRRCA
jgi:hypothetical protein